MCGLHGSQRVHTRGESQLLRVLSSSISALFIDFCPLVIPLSSFPPCFLGSPPMKPSGLYPCLKLCSGESQLRKLSVSIYLWFLWKSFSILRKTNFGTQIQDAC